MFDWFWIHLSWIIVITLHCVKSVQMRSFFWSASSCIRTEYRDLRSKSPFSDRIQENTDQKKLRTLFTQYLVIAIFSSFSLTEKNKKYLSYCTNLTCFMANTNILLQNSETTILLLRARFPSRNTVFINRNIGI